ncbi:unnamed protein product [Discula destructiva]
MAMDPDADETLRRLAAGDSMDYSAWPLLLATVVSRIEKIAINDFPVPRIPQQASAPPPPSLPPPSLPPPSPEPRFLSPLPPSTDPAEPPSSSSEPDQPAALNTTTLSGASSSSGPSSSSQDTNKENAAPPPAPSFAPLAPPAVALELEPGTLPPQITAMLAEITGVLTETFHTYPPHTIQRLSELLLEPRKHYRSLPAYLHAVDRVVHVTSGNNIYPLPPALSDMSHMHINGAAESSSAREDTATDQELPTQAVWRSSSSSGGAPIGSDEALGGALLTPIPWLARRAANGGDGSSESGESSTLGSEAGGPSPVSSHTNASAPTRQGRQYEMQVRTESTETIDGPNGMGRIETVSVSINGVSSMSAAQQQRVISQGELIRQEQRAGVVPVNRSGPVVVTSSSASMETPDTAMSGGEGDAEETSKDTSSEQSDDDMADDEEAPHARGPDLIGAADMGPQTGGASTFSISHVGNTEVRGIDVEAAVGRKHESQPPLQPGVPAVAASDNNNSSRSSSNSDDAVVLTPASSEAEPTATAPEPVQETVEGEEATAKDEAVELKKQEISTKGGEDAGPDEDMDAAPKSATLSARSSPVKREAEDDISGAESEPKRLKSSTVAPEDAPSGGADLPVEAETVPAGAAAEIAAAEVDADADADVDAEPEVESKDEAMKTGESETGAAAPTSETATVTAAEGESENTQEGTESTKVSDPSD